MRELILPVSIVLILGSMLLPLPPFILDIFLASNLLFALTLLLVALYLPEPLKLSSLPTILLLATLYRLSLNISSTRLILGSGEAGKTIEAFGEVVVQGNLAVGIVIFLVITLVQFLVIAKGAERVAEVSARFTLDALPGRQMSIDADVRAGLLDFHLARDKRQELQTESRFYGALDGAMKFVKGDAIAGLVITIINCFGGLLIGILSDGLPFTLALQKYTILTIGDGLLSQIPALLNSLAAGMVVTRVSRGDNAALAEELITQLSQSRAALGIAGVFAFTFAALPGAPAFQLLCLGSLLVFFSLFSRTKDLENAKLKEAKGFIPKVPPLLALEIDEKYIGELLTFMKPQYEKMQELYFEKDGILIPAPACKAISNLGSWRILFRGNLLRHGEIEDKLGGVELSKRVMKAFENFVGNRASELIDDQYTRRLLDLFDSEFPELIASFVPSIVSVTQVTEVLRSLVEEEVSIRSIDVILQSLGEHGNKTQDPKELLNEVRIVLKHQICAKYVDDQGSLNVATFDRVATSVLEKSLREGCARFPEILDICKEHEASASSIPLVVAKEFRGVLRSYVTTIAPKLRFIAFEEIPQNHSCVVVKTLTLNQALEDREAA